VGIRVGLSELGATPAFGHLVFQTSSIKFYNAFMRRWLQLPGYESIRA
jgi:hypothetical protein